MYNFKLFVIELFLLLNHLSDIYLEVNYHQKCSFKFILGNIYLHGIGSKTAPFLDQYLLKWLQ